MLFEDKKFTLVGKYIEYDYAGNSVKTVQFQLKGRRNLLSKISGKITEGSNGIPEKSVIDGGILSKSRISFKKIYQNFWYTEDSQLKNLKNIRTEIQYSGSYDKDNKRFTGIWFSVERFVVFEGEEYKIPAFEGTWDGKVDFE